MSKNNSVDLEDKEKDEEMVEDENQDTGTDSSDGDSQDDSNTDAGDSEDWEARAKKAEAILARQNKKKDKPASEPNQQPNNPPPQIDAAAIAKEVRLLASLSDEEIAQAKKVAQVTGDLESALNDDLFKTWQKDFKEKQRREKAKLGASHGSGKPDSNDFNRPMTDEEHKEAWKKRYGF